MLITYSLYSSGRTVSCIIHCIHKRPRRGIHTPAVRGTIHCIQCSAISSCRGHGQHLNALSRLSLCIQAHVLFERSNVCTQARILLFQLCAFSLCSAAKQALLTLASTGSRIVEASFSSSCDFIALYSSLLPVHLVAGPVCRMCFRMRVAPAPLFHGQKRIALHIRVDVVALAHTGHTFPHSRARCGRLSRARLARCMLATFG